MAFSITAALFYNGACDGRFKKSAKQVVTERQTPAHSNNSHNIQACIITMDFPLVDWTALAEESDRAQAKLKQEKDRNKKRKKRAAETPHQRSKRQAENRFRYYQHQHHQENTMDLFRSAEQIKKRKADAMSDKLDKEKDEVDSSYNGLVAFSQDIQKQQGDLLGVLAKGQENISTSQDILKDLVQFHKKKEERYEHSVYVTHLRMEELGFDKVKTPGKALREAPGFVSTPSTVASVGVSPMASTPQSAGSAGSVATRRLFSPDDEDAKLPAVAEDTEVVEEAVPQPSIKYAIVHVGGDIKGKGVSFSSFVVPDGATMVVQIEDMTVLLFENGTVVPCYRKTSTEEKKYLSDPLNFVESDGSRAMIVQLSSFGYRLVALSKTAIFTCEYCNGKFGTAEKILMHMDTRHPPAISSEGAFGFYPTKRIPDGVGELVQGSFDDFESYEYGIGLSAVKPKRTEAKALALGEKLLVLGWYKGKKRKDPKTSRVFVFDLEHEEATVGRSKYFTEDLIKDIAATSSHAFALYKDGAIAQSSNLVDWTLLKKRKADWIAADEKMVMTFDDDKKHFSFVFQNMHDKATFVDHSFVDAFRQGVSFSSLIDMDVSSSAGVFLAKVSVVPTNAAN